MSATCRHVRVDHVVPGWSCCQCGVYNGYQRPWCMHCGHAHCYDVTGVLGEEARQLAEIGHDLAKVAAWTAAKDARTKIGDA